MTAHRHADPARRHRRGSGRLLVALGVMLGSACWAKDSGFFGATLTSVTPPPAPPPAPPPPPPVLDITPPTFLNLLPITGIGALNSNHFGGTATDPTGSNGATPSGVSASSFKVTLLNGTLVPVTVAGLSFSGSFSTVPDGQNSLTYSVADLAGNTAMTTIPILLKRTGPAIAVSSVPPLSFSSGAASVPFIYTGTITDPFFNSAQIKVTQPGPDGLCGTADDIAFPVGTTGGTVSQNVFTLGAGAFNTTFTAYNGVPFGGTAHTTTYCTQLTALDNAQDETGASHPNTTTTAWQSTLTWNPQAAPFAWGLAASCQDFPGFGTVYLSISTTPAQPNLAFTATVTGPTGGVTGSGVIPGTLSAQGIATVQNNVSIAGTYNWSILGGGVTGTASTTIGVNCQ